ncbi:hypothetical protein [Streptomyces scabiei]|uniref:hypothetical protein n=1 Tax=Streptomyces scabiei TaxID=1930 RepID=UPI00131AC7ED|nr:hypothetical protein [Streptomyces scabiei]
MVGQEERHLRLVAGREPGRELGPLLRLEEGVAAFAARRLLVVPGDARRADVHDRNSPTSGPTRTCNRTLALP